MVSTETALREWRTGSTQAERLAVGVLRLEGFRNVEPQAPVGGPDEGADIFCERGGRFWVCAVYFPSTEKDFKAVEAKFDSDLAKITKLKKHGVVFFTNQRLTRDQRKALSETALAKNYECTIYDVERIRGVLDSAEGYGLRAAYLGIPMSTDEQIAFFAQRENGLSDALSQNTENMQAILFQLRRIQEGQHHVAHSVGLLATAQNLTVEPLKSLDPLIVGEISVDGQEQLVSKTLSPDLIRLAHRLVCFDLPSRFIGHFRTEKVFIVKAGAAAEEPTFAPPPPEDVPRLVEKLCQDWRLYIEAAESPQDHFSAIASTFHQLLVIHPFLDGNGRVARSLMMQQCVELFGRVDMSRFDRGINYYAALQTADGGDLGPLADLIREAVGA